MKNNQEIALNEYQKYVDENTFLLNETSIRELLKNDNGHLNNVTIGIEKYGYGVLLLKDNKVNIDFSVFMMTGLGRIRGYSIKLNSSDEKWMRYLISFSIFIAKEYEDLDPVDTYNTLLSNCRALFEKLGFFTITNYDIQRFDRLNPLLLTSNPRGTILIYYEDKIEVYKSIFSHVVDTNKFENKIYLMHSESSNLIKIGRSKNPNTRERTLQGRDPKLNMITYWDAPLQIEKDLHNKFIHKRVRGEWFDLNFGDLNTIKEIMSEYTTS